MPKGVAMPHGALCNHMSWMIERFAFASSDVVLDKDAAELRCQCMGGACAVAVWSAPVAGASRRQGPGDPCRVTADAGVSVLQLVPSMLQLIVAEADFGRKLLTRVQRRRATRARS